MSVKFKIRDQQENIPAKHWNSIVILFMLSFISCSINGSFQGLYSYYDKTNMRAPYLIQKPASPLCNLIQPDTPVVYAINGMELKNCLAQFEKSLVYIWRPKCTSDICVSPKDLQKFCQSNNIELFIVAEYYDYENMTLNFPIKRPIFGVDCEYYSTHLTQKYVSMFLTDLIGEKTTYQEKQFFLLNYGCVLDMSSSMEKLKI
ncbi:MAG: hypothetical protein IT261_12220 [Saprospiraceae bacterium]|nr:hypothetical protein [Saprospiraceae bacterium]